VVLTSGSRQRGAETRNDDGRGFVLEERSLVRVCRSVPMMHGCRHNYFALLPSAR
jgi:hypothetical protein